MIASLVATLTQDACRLPGTIDAIASCPEIEIGEFDAESRRIPLAIDAPNRMDVEEATQWLQKIPGVALVDVIFVHFEEATTQ